MGLPQCVASDHRATRNLQLGRGPTAPWQIGWSGISFVHVTAPMVHPFDCQCLQLQPVLFVEGTAGQEHGSQCTAHSFSRGDARPTQTVRYTRYDCHRPAHGILTSVVSAVSSGSVAPSPVSFFRSLSLFRNFMQSALKLSFNFFTSFLSVCPCTCPRIRVCSCAGVGTG